MHVYICVRKGIRIYIYVYIYQQRIRHQESQIGARNYRPKRQPSIKKALRTPRASPPRSLRPL